MYHINAQDSRVNGFNPLRLGYKVSNFSRVIFSSDGFLGQFGPRVFLSVTIAGSHRLS